MCPPDSCDSDTRTDCICPPTYPPPSGYLECSPKASSLDGGGNIKLYLGETYNAGASLTLYSTEYEDFKVDNYSCKELYDSGILNFQTFSLTEHELLSSGSWENWILYMSLRLKCNDEETFAAKVLKSLGVSLTNIKQQVTVGLSDFVDTNKQKTLPELFTRLVSLTSQNLSCLVDAGEKYRKAILAYEWFKKIYNEFYFKKFLVRIGENNNFNVPFHGVCVKKKDGSVPTDPMPFYITGNGSAQGLYSSDSVSTEGGYPSRDTASLLGLGLTSKNIKLFKTEDGKIDCFSRFGKITESDGSLTVYNKFGKEFIVDFTKISPDSYVIDNGNLYIKCSISDKIYFDSDGQWALISLASMVPFRLKKSNMDRSSIATFVSAFIDLNSLLYQVIEKILSFDTITGANNYTFGASNSYALYNAFIGNDISFFPKGFVLPLVSNIFSYGPYYYDANTGDGGGVEYEKNDSLKPWNFINDESSNINNAYDNMNCVGQALARDGAKGLQKLEKGTITIAGLPEYNIGHSVTGNPSDPTIITDISIEYGTGGIKTTYNFSTYSPRFGRPSKYILDSWQSSLQTSQNINNILKQQQLSATSLGNTLNQRISEGLINLGKYGDAGPKSRTRNTPSKLLISGYYLNFSSSNVPYDNNNTLTVNDISNSHSDMQDCYQCIEEPAISYPFTPANTSENINRLYTFAEAHESYQEDYIQNSYNQLCIFSLDGFFLPVSLKGDDGWESSASHPRLPRFTMRLDESGSFVEWNESSDVSYFKTAPGHHPLTKTRDEMPPFELGSKYGYALPIHQMYLNPILSSGIIVNEWGAGGDVRSNNSNKGFVISSITFGDSFDKYQLTFADTEEDIKQSETNFRFSALRGPLVLQGWGYDTSGKPIPNAADGPKEAESGKFRRDKLTDKFMKNWLENPRTWPVGPVDLRFDRERGVWSCPSPNKILVARLLQSLSTFGSAEAKLINPTAGGIRFYEDHHISGPDGEDIRSDIEQTRIRVYDFLGIEKPLCKCDIVYVYWDSNRYIVLESSRVYKTIEECEVCTPTPCPCPSPSLSPRPSQSQRPSPQPSQEPSQGASEPPASQRPSASAEPSQSPVPSESQQPSYSPAISPQPSPSDCWFGLDVLKQAKNYNPCRTQALIHRDGCLEWEDIVQCDPIANQEERAKEELCLEN